MVPNPSEPFLPFDQERLELIRELRPRVVSFHFGLPSSKATQEIKASGCVVLSSATTVAEAQQLEAGGADAIIAQGVEAGGHRGTFTQSPGAGTIGTVALVPQIVDAVRVPVIAAGGISMDADCGGVCARCKWRSDGHGLSRLPRGHGVAAVYWEALRTATEEATVITSAFTGRPARALWCRLVDDIPDVDALDFPLQASLLAPLWRVPDDKARRAFMPMWAGQSVCFFFERFRLERWSKRSSPKRRRS